MRRRSGTNQWRLRGQNHQASSSQVRAMEWGHLRSVVLRTQHVLTPLLSLALVCADIEPGEGRLEAGVKALVGDVGDGLESSAGERCSG